jgi:hypothetical protein
VHDFRGNLARDDLTENATTVTHDAPFDKLRMTLVEATALILDADTRRRCACPGSARIPQSTI